MSDPIYKQGNILITPSIAKFGNATYPIASIGSVLVETEKSGMGPFVMIIGAIVSLVVWFKMSALLACVIFVGALIAIALLPETLKITLKTSSGDVSAFSSNDKQLIRRIHTAIETAFARRSGDRSI